MSYSFELTSHSKTGAVHDVATALDAVVAGDPLHAKDKAAALDAAKASIDILREPEGLEHIFVHMYGSLGWEGDYNSPRAFTSADVHVSASIRRDLVM